MEIIELTKKEFEELFFQETGLNIKNSCECKLERRIKRLEKTISKTIKIVKK
jgi:hypothetical protein